MESASWTKARPASRPARKLCLPRACIGTRESAVSRLPLPLIDVPVHYVLLLLILNESPSVESRDGMRDADDIRMHERSRPRLGNYEAHIFYRAESVFHVLKGRLRAILRVQLSAAG